MARYCNSARKYSLFSLGRSGIIGAFFKKMAGMQVSGHWETSGLSGLGLELGLGLGSGLGFG